MTGSDGFREQLAEALVRLRTLDETSARHEETLGRLCRKVEDVRVILEGKPGDREGGLQGRVRSVEDEIGSQKKDMPKLREVYLWVRSKQKIEWMAIGSALTLGMAGFVYVVVWLIRAMG